MQRKSSNWLAYERKRVDVVETRREEKEWVTWSRPWRDISLHAKTTALIPRSSTSQLLRSNYWLRPDLLWIVSTSSWLSITALKTALESEQCPNYPCQWNRNYYQLSFIKPVRSCIRWFMSCQRRSASGGLTSCWRGQFHSNFFIQKSSLITAIGCESGT